MAEWFKPIIYGPIKRESAPLWPFLLFEAVLGLAVMVLGVLLLIGR
jgi:hypothetical protein